MLESDSPHPLSLEPAPMARPRRVVRSRPLNPSRPPNLPEIQPLPRWARLNGGAGGVRNAMFLAGAGIAHLDQILRAGADVSSAGRDSVDVSNAGKNFGVEPVFSGALRQRLALTAAAACARLARLREDEAALRDAEHLTGCGGETSPAGRLHRLFRLFASRSVKFDAATLAIAAEHVGAPSAMDAQGLAGALRDAMIKADEPLAAAARVSEAAMHCLAAVPAIDAEIFVLWLADVALAQKLGWKAPIPLLATVVAHPALRRGQNGRRARPRDSDWSTALAGAYALAAGEAIDVAGALSRQTQKLLDAAPKLRAKSAAPVIEMLLADDCVTPARAAKTARLSDRGARRLFDRLIELRAVRELSGRASFRLYGL
ncbi:DUF1403 family protein [Methylocystis sp. L43]|jgi:hypothetical protein|uniref:DUF1403 family protein n=1 Tax=Methylocystis rosea TaxID=173366 RepID=A0ABX6EPN2_9HYPH|nr:MULTISPECIES: DUF1403 family protein [Methylocystis]MBG0797211.1 DUF1403 family protein [Methylocystis sp. L43]MBG0804189.1 DUF1403 family protein [Methylocystis sp. H15]PWB89022.1 hypothetical protein C5688_18085 [Methylocystis sp. MitZ-2018]QGM96003.1 DUF1403 family protein [Methylocystis rosea]